MHSMLARISRRKAIFCCERFMFKLSPQPDRLCVVLHGSFSKPNAVRVLFMVASSCFCNMAVA